MKSYILNNIEYVKNKQYIYVLSSNNDYKNYDDNCDNCDNGNNGKLDVSIFEIEEWDHLTKISKVFEKEVLNLISSSDDTYININKTYKDSVYYLYHSPFCRYNGFNDLLYNKLEINDIYEVVFDLVKKNTEKITINEFRTWITENYVNIQNHYINII